MKTEKELLDLIDKWHESSALIPLHEYLGWTFKEYSIWVETGVQPKNEN